LTPPFVVPLKALVQILGVTDIVTAVPVTLEDVEEIGHGWMQKSLPKKAGSFNSGGSDGARTRNLRRDRPAL
jgi:hypothetical protein